MDMFDYIKSQSSILSKIIENRKEITKNFVDIYKENNIRGITIIGSGSSFNSSSAAKYFMEKLLKVKVNVIYPYTFNNYENILDKDEIFITVSQGGKSTATIDSVKKCNKLGLINITLTSEKICPLRDVAKAVVNIACGEETVGYKTKGYTSTILTLYLLALETAYALKKINNEEYNLYIKEIEEAICNIDNIIAETDSWYKTNKDDLVNAENVMVVGYGPNYGTALEGRLKLNETTKISVICHELEEFMHGPQLSLNEEYYLFFVASSGTGYERIKNLYNYVSNVTKHSYLIQDKENETKDQRILRASFSRYEEINPIEYIIPFQVLAYRMSNGKGIDLSIKKFPDFYSKLGVKC